MSVTVDYTTDFDRDEWSAWLSKYGIDLHNTHRVELDLAGGEDHVVATAYVYKTNLAGNHFVEDGEIAMEDPLTLPPTRIPDYELRQD